MQLITCSNWESLERKGDRNKSLVVMSPCIFYLSVPGSFQLPAQMYTDDRSRTEQFTFKRMTNDDNGLSHYMGNEEVALARYRDQIGNIVTVIQGTLIDSLGGTLDCYHPLSASYILEKLESCCSQGRTAGKCCFSSSLKPSVLL